LGQREGENQAGSAERVGARPVGWAARPKGRGKREREARELGLRSKTEKGSVFLFRLFFFYFKPFQNLFLKQFELF